MNNVKTLFGQLILLLMASISVGAVVTEDFSSSHDFIADGVSGTVWDGIVVNGGVDTTQDAILSVLDTNTTSGALRFETSNTQWEGNADDGALLYVNVSGNFVATVQITDGQFPSLPAGGPVDYLGAGLMARSPIDADIDYLYLNAFDRPEWGATHQFRSANNGSAEYLVNNSGHLGNPVLANMSWLRLSRSGSVFTASISDDGINWIEHSIFDRPDMPTDTQVGIAHSTFSGNTAWTEFDNFSVDVPEPATIAILSLGSVLLRTRRNRN